MTLLEVASTLLARRPTCYTTPTMPTELGPQPERKVMNQPEQTGDLKRPDQEKPREQRETAREKERKEPGKAAETGQKRSFNPLRRTPPPIPATRDEITVKVEKILEENIGDVYRELSPTAKEAFKIKGEQTSRAIREILASGKSQVEKIFTLIFEWLKILPGVNRFFLEQEAKIKTDRLMKLVNKE